MDRRKFVKSMSLLGGFVLSGTTFAEALERQESGRKPRYGNHEKSGWEVIVIGGGASGCAAAIAAAREGARTLLIEATHVLGGMGTSGLIPTWTPFSGKDKTSYGGIAEKVFRVSCKEIYHPKPEQSEALPVDAEALKRVYDEMLVEAGVELLLGSRVVEVKNKTDKEIESLLVANHTGLTEYKAEFFVDCTGNAGIATRSGARLLKTDDSVEAGFCFLLGNVDFYSYNYHFRKHPRATAEIVRQLVYSGKYPLLKESHFENQLMHSSIVKFRAGSVYEIDPAEPDSYSKGLVRGRAIAQQVLQVLKEYFPETFAAAVLINSGTQLELPVLSRIMGDYIYTKEDFNLRKSFDDEIGCRIPYRILTPVGLRNLLVAGQAVSADTDICESLGTMPVCLVTGEAAGMAAGLLLKTKTKDVHAMDISLLRHRLKDEGQNI